MPRLEGEPQRSGEGGSVLRRRSRDAGVLLEPRLGKPLVGAPGGDPVALHPETITVAHLAPRRHGQVADHRDPIVR